MLEVNSNEVAVQIENMGRELEALKLVYKKDESEIVKIGILTNIAYETLPNYKNYKNIVSGITQARMIKGVNGKRYVIESQIKKLFKTYDLDDINNNIIEKAAELMVLTFDSVLTKSGKKVKEKYIDAMEDIEFLYINLKLSVKIISESLKDNDVTISNKTLNYIIEGIRNEKKSIAQKYIDAYLSGDEEQIIAARENYREKMFLMLNDYVKKLKISYDDSIQMGMEQTIVESLGKERLDIITGYLLVEIRERVLQDSRIQRKLSFSDTI